MKFQRRLNRVTGVETGGGSTLERYSYTLNLTGHRLTMTEGTGRSVRYRYDGLYRLTEEAVSGAPQGANGSVTYSYDAVGNRLSRTSTLTSISSTTATYDANDRLQGQSYDANGNTLTATGTTYTYDFEDRLSTSSQGNTTIVYDGDGNRVAQTTNGLTTHYLVDDRNPSGYAQVVEEIVGGQVQRTYTYGLDLISQNLSSSSGWTASFYQYDALGTVRSLTDAAGTVTDRYAYDAFGVPLTSSGTTANAYRFTGEQWDEALNLYYLRARYYTPDQGRFLTIDTYPCRASEPLTLHKYLYTHADPVNNIDPSGHVSAAEYGFSLGVALRITVALYRLERAISCVLNTSASTLEVAMRSSGGVNLNRALCMAMGSDEDEPAIPWGGTPGYWEDYDYCKKKCRDEYEADPRGGPESIWRCVNDCMKGHYVGSHPPYGPRP